MNFGNDTMTVEASPSALRPQNNLRGVVLMTGGFAMFSAADVIAKLLTADYHPVQIVMTRQMGLVLGVLVLIAMNGPQLLRSVSPPLQIARGFSAIISAITFVFAISYVPLADAIAVTFIAPFIVTILGATLLGEPVGIRRWSAVGAGFVGTMIIIRPGMGVFDPAILLVIVAAAAFAVRQILSRHLCSRDRTATSLAYTSLTTIAVLAIPLPFFWRTPLDMTDVGLMALMAVLAGAGEFMIIRALEVANAVVVAPTHYSLLIFGTFWGYLLFADLPDGWTWAGAFVIVASGLYMLYRERKVKA
jgi:drug/metabolite transporter (DMT)-like permease